MAIWSCTCGAKYTAYQGRCSTCKRWNSINRGFRRGSKHAANAPPEKAMLLRDVSADQPEFIPSGIIGLDAVLGGGIIRGKNYIISGEPGAGKSTLLMQALLAYAEQGLKVLYVTGEESKEAIALRARRVGFTNSEHIYIIAEERLAAIETSIRELRPIVCVIDSVQTIRFDNLSTNDESKAIADAICKYGANNGMTSFLVGHVTKEGIIAGPKFIEHIVDVVLVLRGRKDEMRRLESDKNREGSAGVVGFFDMTEKGLIDHDNHE